MELLSVHRIWHTVNYYSTKASFVLIHLLSCMGEMTAGQQFHQYIVVLHYCDTPSLN